MGSLACFLWDEHHIFFRGIYSQNRVPLDYFSLEYVSYTEWRLLVYFSVGCRLLNRGSLVCFSVEKVWLGCFSVWWASNAFFSVGYAVYGSLAYVTVNIYNTEFLLYESASTREEILAQVLLQGILLSGVLRDWNVWRNRGRRNVELVQRIYSPVVGHKKRMRLADKMAKVSEEWRSVTGKDDVQQ